MTNSESERDFDSLMEEFGGAFDNAEASEMGSDLPDGQYVAVIGKCGVNNSKSSGRLQVSWDCTVVWDAQGSKYKNRHLFFHDGITQVDKDTKRHSFSEMGVGILKKRFKVLGFPHVTKDTIPQVVTQAVGRVVVLTQKQKPKSDFINYYFDGMLASSLATFTPPANAADLKARLSMRPTGSVAAPALPTTQQQPTTPAPKLEFTEE